MTDQSTIGADHLRRAAFVYIRQSSPAQVENNTESTRRQYALVDKALRLGWPRAAVSVVDDDLGLSGAQAAGRSGFAHMATEVAMGRVGIVLCLEVSRLARNNADWYRLLDLCALARTLIADTDGSPEFSIARSVTRCREAASLPGMYKACVTIVASPAERSRLQHRPGNW